MGTLHALAKPEPPPEKWFVRDKKGVITFQGATYEDHVEAWGDAQIQVDAGLWAQAQIAASLVTKYNDRTVARFAHDVRRGKTWIYDLARTYRAFPENSSRLEILSFTHHVEASKAGTASAKVKDATKAITKAHDEEWSVRELRSYVETGVEPMAKGVKKPDLPASIQKIYDRAVREHLDASIQMIRGQMQTPPDPLLETVYRRCVEIMEWQRDRSLYDDCMSIVSVFAGDDGGSAGIDVASEDYIASWLNSRGFIMADDDLGSGGCPKNCPAKHEHEEPYGLLGLLIKIRLLRYESREGSRGPTQRGSIPGVYSIDFGYFEELETVSTNPHAPERLVAVHKDWIDRLKRFAPEFLPKKV